MFFKPLCTLIRSIWYDNKSQALSVSVGKIFSRPFQFTMHIQIEYARLILGNALINIHVPQCMPV